MRIGIVLLVLLPVTACGAHANLGSSGLGSSPASLVLLPVAIAAMAGHDEAPGPPAMTAEETRECQRQTQVGLATARELTKLAVQAGRRGDCAMVERIRVRVLALPEIRIEGGVHDTIFLREPVVLKCLAAQKQKRERCLATQRKLAKRMIGASEDVIDEMMEAMPICVPAS